MRTFGFRFLALGMWLIMLTALITGCGKGFTPSANLSTLSCLENCGSEGNLGGDAPSGNDQSPLDLSEFNGKLGASSLFGETQIIDIDLVNKTIEFRLPMLANPYIDGAQLSFPIPQIPGATVGIITLPNGRSALAVKMPIAKYLEGINTLPPSKLPNGDPIPGVPDGELPSLAIEINKAPNIHATVYLAPTVVGIYVNTPFNPFISLTLPIRNKSKQILGYFSVIPAKVGPPAYDGGFFVSVKLPADLARLLNSVL